MPNPTERPTVRVFVSSTFQDMHAERDHLVTVVFPELRERIARLGFDFFDVDLRWGLPLKGIDGERANAWTYCKRWIDRVDPFFVCLLGQRYGWIPAAADLRDAPEESALAGLSITEMEIRHAAFRPATTKRSYFYFRHASVPADAPPDVFSDFVDQPNYTRLQALKERIEQHAGRPIRPYDCLWTGRGFGGLDGFGRMVLEDLWSGVLRDARYVPHAAWEAVMGHAPDDDPLYTDDTRPVPEETWEAIVRRIELQAQSRRPTEADQRDAFARSRIRWFHGRERELGLLTEFCSKERPAEAAGVCVVIGPAGQGKSALLARLERRLQDEDRTVVAHFVGATEQLPDMRGLVRALCDSLAALGLDTEQNGSAHEDLPLYLRTFLERGPTGPPLVLLIDGIDQLSGGHDLSWLPARLSRGTTVVLSCRAEDDAHPNVQSATLMSVLKARDPAPEWLALGPLEPQDVAAITREFLAEYCKELDSEDIENLCHLDQARNPLYLHVLLHELRILGGNEAHLRVRTIISSLERERADAASLFDWFLENLEVLGRDAVRCWCVFLSLGRTGMRSRELRALLARKLGSEADPQAARIERSVRRYLQRRGDRVTFFHPELVRAVERRYLDGPAAAWHADVTALFSENWPTGDAHALEELPYHLARADQYDTLARLLTDLRYLHLRTSLCDVHALIDDYDRLGEAKTPRLAEYQSFLRRHSERLTRHRGLLFSLVKDEGFPDLRGQAEELAATGQWTQGWLRASSLPLPAARHDGGGSERIDVLAACEYGLASAVTLAPRARLAMAATRLGEVSVVDIPQARIRPAKITIRRERPLALASSADGNLLAVAFDNGEADLIVLGNSPGTLGGETRWAASFSLRLPEYEAPFLALRDRVLWCQQASGAVTTMDPASGITRVILPDDSQESELRGILVTDAATLILLRRRGGTCLVRLAPDGAHQTLLVPRAGVTASCVLQPQRVALTLSSCRLVVFDLTTGIRELASLPLERPALSMTANRNRILWACGMGRLHAWNPDEAGAATEVGRLSGSTQHLAVADDGTFLAAGELSATHFALLMGSQGGRGRILAVFGGEAPTRFFAFQAADGKLDLLTNESRRDNVASGDEASWTAFAHDGQGHLLAANITRQITIIEALAPHAFRKLDLGDTPRAAAGSPEGGFWLLTAAGEVVFLTLDGTLHSIHHSREEVLGGFAIRFWPSILVWTTLTRVSAETVPTVAFVRTTASGARPTGHVTARAFAVSDGFLETFAYDARTDQLLTVWQAGAHTTKYLRLGRPEDYATGAERRHDLAQIGERVRGACHSQDGGLYLLTHRGAILRLDPETFETCAVLAPSVPFTDLTEQHGAATPLLIRGRAEIVSCVYVGVDHA
ncbi:MAG: DUF4062 domain-containing protein [Polyangia bacterium]